MKKSLYTLLSAVGVVTLVTGCSSITSTLTGGDEQSSSSSVLSESSSSSTLIMEPGADGLEDDDGTTVDVDVDAGVSARVITITAENFVFSPNAITVKKGEKITLRLTGITGNHGFAVADLGINTAVSEGKTVDVELPTDKAGTFNFRCSVPCGIGHNEMIGTITITE